VLLPYSWITAVCVTASIVDLREHRLPNAIVLPAYPVLAALFTATALANQDADDLLRAAGATVVAIPLYTAIALASHGGLGAGDVKLGGLLAMALGWTSWTTVAAGTLLGWTLAAAHILLRRSARHPDTGQPIPMGPFLSAGALAAVITTTP
jgi:leader peptidase (prepilin peptidase)/N-methyltransferase